MSGPLRVRAFAKINLSLRVLGRRDDGYHELRTIFQSIALHDTLTFGRTRGPLTLSCNDPRCPADDRNLVWKAAALVWRAAGRPGRARGVVVHIRKRIPLEAGLGGGSADGAASLRALGQLWKVRAIELPRFAAALGADVPFCLEGGTALGLDRGDSLFPLVEPPRRWVLLALPPFGVSTRDAYAWLDESRSRRPPPAPAVNDLEGPVADRFPSITRLAADLAGAGAGQAAMSGSGSTVFGLFDHRMRAEAARSALRRRHPEVTWLLTRTIGRAEHGRRSAPYV
jgi:4-diphosphocytidyl-2-C-methyl-D-erythritol kinase